MQDTAKKMATKSHREKIEEFNQRLANMSEHYDIPKVLLLVKIVFVLLMIIRLALDNTGGLLYFIASCILVGWPLRCVVYLIE